MSLAARREGEGPLAIVCGAGSLPLAVADRVAASGRRVLLFPLHGAARPEDYAGRAHRFVRLVKIGPVLRDARAAGCRDMVLIGSLVRPSLWQLRFDWATLKLAPRALVAYRGGDDHLLSTASKLVEQFGFRLLGAHEVAPEILVPKGALGGVTPSERDCDDIAFGLAYLRAAGPFDIGQAVVVAGRHVLAVEAAEGTDGMLARVAELRANGRIRTPGGVLVKAPKPQQDRRFDLPSIGPITVEGAANAGLAGIATLAGETIMAEPAALVATADRAGLFVVGMPEEASA